QESGLSGYQVPSSVSPQNQTIFPSEDGFPVNWDPRYTAAWGLAATVDTYSNYRVHNSTRKMAIKNDNGTYSANQADSPDGFLLPGNLPVTDDQGVHSLSDVNVYSFGPGHEDFRGIQNSPDIALKIANILGLGKNKNVTCASKPSKGRGSVKL
ncbi:hypothetical protein JCM11491_006895, partial [Sporobolomyces phaffii]